jgi:ribulose-5-phosphate 4-epimerase/fuculose-1-phosphate aldolase
MLSRISLVLAISVMPVVVGAHHSPAAIFVLNERISITGTVVEYRFVNPHALIVLDVAQQDGSVER